MFTFSVVPITAARIPDGELEALLRPVYVDGGFTEASIADSAFLSAIAVAREAGARRMILWTQSSMTAAQRLYVKHGFGRVPHLDFSREERSFLAGQHTYHVLGQRRHRKEESEIPHPRAQVSVERRGRNLLRLVGEGESADDGSPARSALQGRSGIRQVRPWSSASSAGAREQ